MAVAKVEGLLFKGATLLLFKGLEAAMHREP